MRAIATALDADAFTWIEVPRHTPRFHGVERALLVERRARNLGSNPRCEGGVVGAPGTLPTGWTGTQSSVAARVLVGGVNMVPLGFVFAGAGDKTVEFATAAMTADDVAEGDFVTGSVFARTEAGSLTNLTTQLEVVYLDALGVVLATHVEPFTPGGARTRPAMRAPAAPVDTNRVIFRVRVIATGAADITLAFGWPQVERTQYATTPALPPPGTLAQVNREVDLVRASFADLFPSGEGTVYGRWRQDDVTASVSAGQTMVSLQNGAATERISVQKISESLFRFSVAIGGTIYSSAGSAIVTDSWNAFGFTFGAGKVIHCANGDTPAELVHGVPAGMTDVYLGSRAGNLVLDGVLLPVGIEPRMLSAAELQARVAAL